MEGQRNLLVSASGEGHKAITTLWTAELITGIIGAAIMFSIAGRYDGSIFGVRFRGDMYYVFTALAWIIIIAIPVTGCLAQSRIAKTCVRVFEDGIEGLGVVPKFPLSFIIYGSLSSLQMSEFRLAYNQVSSVDVVNDETLIIHAGNVQHKIYAMNAKEVRDVILSQKNNAPVQVQVQETVSQQAGFCTKCGAALNPENAFCGKCGARV